MQDSKTILAKGCVNILAVGFSELEDYYEISWYFTVRIRNSFSGTATKRGVTRVLRVLSSLLFFFTTVKL